MTEVQGEQAPPIASARIVKKRAIGLPRRGKKPYPKERLRVLISVRILPATKAALLRIGSDNIGRAIDEIVAACMSDSEDLAASCRAGRELLAAHPSIPVTRI